MISSASEDGSIIPVLGVPVLNRGDLLLRCLRSVDFPVGLTIIVNNGTDASVHDSIREIVDGFRLVRSDSVPFPKELYEKTDGSRLLLVSSGTNLGVAASWNLIIREAGDAPYHLIVNNDIQFAPGDLEKVHAAITNLPDHALFFGNHEYAFFAVTRAGVQTIGWFDENFYPAYLEDFDYQYRARQLGISMFTVSDINSVHGENGQRSCTIKSDPELYLRNKISHSNNARYYRAKWGAGRKWEIFKHPFNNPDWPLQEWILEKEFREMQRAAARVPEDWKPAAVRSGRATVAVSNSVEQPPV